MDDWKDSGSMNLPGDVCVIDPGGDSETPMSGTEAESVCVMRSGEVNPEDSRSMSPPTDVCVTEAGGVSETAMSNARPESVPKTQSEKAKKQDPPYDVCVTESGGVPNICLEKPATRTSKVEVSGVKSDDVVVALLDEAMIDNRKVSVIKPDDKRNKIILSIRIKSIYDPFTIIFDTAATVNIFRNKDLFIEPPKLDDNGSVNLVGFDTKSAGHVFVLGKGILKMPFDGIEAYYSPDCIGNIMSEARHREDFQIYDRRCHSNWRNDTMVSIRKRSRGSSSRIDWARGSEDIFVADIRHYCNVEALITVPQAMSYKLTETESIVKTWLGQLGLTERESVISLAITKIRKSKRLEVISACLSGMSITERQVTAILEEYLAKAKETKGKTLPVLDTVYTCIESLRKMSISESVTTSKKRGLMGGEIDNIPKIEGDTDPGKTIDPHSKKKSLTTTAGGNVAVCSSSKVLNQTSTDSSVSNIEIQGGRQPPNTSMSMDTSMAAPTNAESRQIRVSSDGSSTKADGFSSAKIKDANSKSSQSNLVTATVSFESKMGSEVRVNQSGDVTSESSTDILNSEESMMALWLRNSNMTYQELLVAFLISDLGVNTESELVMLSLAQRGLSKAQIERISLVERWHKKTSFIGLKTLANMIKFRTVKELNGLSVEDVENYSKYVHESDCACNEGKLQLQPAPTFDNAQYSPDACFCDVMQLTTADKSVKFRYLVAVDAQSQYIFSIPLNSLSEQDLKASFTKLIGLYLKKSSRSKLKQLVLDNAGALKSDGTKDLIISLGIEPIYVSPGEHVKIAEASIRIIKSLVRTTVLDSSTKKRFVTMFVPYLMQWVVESINYSLRTGSDHASPYTRFTGKVVSADIHFRVAFLDIILVNEIKDKSTNLDARGRIGLVVARDESERGALIILDIESGQLMKRHYFKLVEGPSYVDRVKSFLNTGKFKNMRVFDVNHLQKFAETSNDLDIPLEAYNDSITQVNNLDSMAMNSGDDNSDINSTPLEVPEVVAITTSIPTVAQSNISDSYKMKSEKTHKLSYEFKLSSTQAMIIETDEDGSCLFNSIAWHFREESGNSSLEIRDRLCNYITMNYYDLTCEGGLTICDHIRLNLQDNDDESALYSDKEMVDSYVQNLRKIVTWADSIEISLIAKLLNIVIVVFHAQGKKFQVKQVFGDKKDNLKSAIVSVFHKGRYHYEVLNIFHLHDKELLKKHLNMLDEEGDVSLDNFLYLKSFSERKEYIMSITAAANPKESINFNDTFEEDTLDEYKIRQLLACLTIDDASRAKSKSHPKPTSEGVASLRSRKAELIDIAQVKELKQVDSKGVLEYILPKDLTPEILENLIPLIMLNKEKFFSDGEFEKMKARLIALGCRQELMENWLKESPTASIQSFYLVILLAAKLNIRLRSKDVTGAFLNADLNEDERIYVLISKKHADMIIKFRPDLKAYLRTNGTLIAILRKCLYGLKQSPQRWYIAIRKILESVGLKVSKHDTCLFYLNDGQTQNFLLLFVDDMLIAFQSEALFKKLSDALVEAFGELSEQEGDVLSFLGITITQKSDCITLDQEGFINKLMGSVKLTSIPKYTNPAASNFSVYEERFLKPQSEGNPILQTKMRQLSMAVMYCALRTRRDVLFLASFLSSVKCPEEQDIEAIERVIIYLFNTIHKKQCFYRAGDIKLTLYGDASHNAFVDAKGQQCEIVYADDHSAAIDMTSTKEKQVTHSSCESEIIVQSKLALRGRRFYYMLVELGIKIPTPIIMFCDNEAAVTLAAQEQINVLGRTKYFNRQIWQIHEVVTSGLVKPTWTASRDMDSDMGTKALMGSNFDRVSNRSFSRMCEYKSVKDQPENEAVVKNASELVPQSSIEGNFKNPYKIHVNSVHGGSATNNNNQSSNHSMNSIPEAVESTSNRTNRAETAVVAPSASSGRSRPYDDEDNKKIGKLGGGEVRPNSKKS